MFKTPRFLLSALIFAPLAMSAFALAPTAFANEEVRAHPTLNLYPRDAADACVPGSLQIRVTINGVKPVGIMKLELFSGPKNFLNKKGKLRRIRVPATASPQLICINVPVPGSYAVVGYHDIDGDRRLKKKWDYTPKEPYGVSNNPVLKKRKIPKYSRAAFDVPSNGIGITINLVQVGKKKK